MIRDGIELYDWAVSIAGFNVGILVVEGTEGGAKR